MVFVVYVYEVLNACKMLKQILYIIYGRNRVFIHATFITV